MQYNTVSRAPVVVTYTTALCNFVDYKNLTDCTQLLIKLYIFSQ